MIQEEYGLSICIGIALVRILLGTACKEMGSKGFGQGVMIQLLCRIIKMEAGLLIM